MKQPANRPSFKMIAVSAFVWPIGVMVFAVGCEKPDPIYLMQHEDPVLRIEGIVQAGEQGRADAVPLLVDRLEEDDQSVRFFAIQSLRELVGTDYGYDYAGTPAERAAAIQRWREAISESGDVSGP